MSEKYEQLVEANQSRNHSNDKVNVSNDDPTSEYRPPNRAQTGNELPTSPWLPGQKEEVQARKQSNNF